MDYQTKQPMNEPTNAETDGKQESDSVLLPKTIADLVRAVNTQAREIYELQNRGHNISRLEYFAAAVLPAAYNMASGDEPVAARYAFDMALAMCAEAEKRRAQ